MSKHGTSGNALKKMIKIKARCEMLIHKQKI